MLKKIKEGDYIPTGFSYIWDGKTQSEGILDRLYVLYLKTPLSRFRRLVLKIYVMQGKNEPWYKTRIVPGGYSWDIRRVGW